MSSAHNICYLCGEPLTGRVNSDHVPMRQLFSKRIRTRHNPDLITLRTHYECNHSYQRDEEYFIHAFSPVAMDSYAGRSTVHEIARHYHVGRNVPLVQTVLGEFERNPSGLTLPSGVVAKRVDGERASRVLWKIIRGLFFYEYDRYLPLEVPRDIKLVRPGSPPPEPVMSLLWHEGTHGKHPAVFDYRYRQFPDIMGSHLWALLFWDRLIVWAMFHDPDCTCDTCIGT
jgi:hypothetical protein